ncbi:MAG: CoA pyrophosphatase [Sphingomonadaceae bacterium]|nr:CoA pyrophosphatase [Sphingomonadaceae bacterium]
MSLAKRLRAALSEGAQREIDLYRIEESEPDAALAGAFADAAVLVPVVDRPEPTLLLTLRTEHLRRHAGQVAFPGGRVDATDADAIDAALREAEEEIALPRSAVEVIGTTDRFRTRTGFHITPVVAVVAPDLPLVPHEFEVAAVFEVPFAFALAPENQIARELELDGRMRSYYEIIWGERRIWGITAALIVNLSRRLRGLW